MGIILFATAFVALMRFIVKQILNTQKRINEDRKTIEELKNFLNN